MAKKAKRRGPKGPITAVEPAVKIKAFPGVGKAKLSANSTISVMLGRGQIEYQVAGFANRFSDDWHKVNGGGKSGGEMGVFVDNSSRGDQGAVASIDAAARVRKVQEHLDAELWSVLIWCACYGKSVKELAEKSGESDRLIAGLLKRALAEVMYCYTGRQPKPSKIIRAGQALVAAVREA